MMVDVKYAYNINDDFPNSIVSTSSLTREIQDSEIKVSLLQINTASGICDVWFKSSLSLVEKSILDRLVAIHSGIEVSEVENPKADDGKIFVAPNIFPLGVLTNFCGVADDIENGISGGGDLLLLSSSSAGETVKYFRYIEWSYLAGGNVLFTGADFGDWVSFMVYCPPTDGVSNPGKGMFMKYPVKAGINMFIPTAGDGDWDLDLTEKENQNVRFMKVKPVPAMGTGFFDWDENTEAVTLNANGAGAFNLFDAALPLSEFVSKMPLIGDGNVSLTVPAVKPIRILPHWAYKVTLHNSSNKYLKLAAMFYRARQNALR
jgi:hypothetical protein